ncbi:MAG: hypothetical protein J3K34DRAFT_401322 [Monoraphidium minutum]|nr:MAG: hypothetical protein J3K34DRAFT_401322 [Monoraphidium minutum]
MPVAAAPAAPAPTAAAALVTPPPAVAAALVTLPLTVLARPPTPASRAAPLPLARSPGAEAADAPLSARAAIPPLDREILRMAAAIA